MQPRPCFPRPTHAIPSCSTRAWPAPILRGRDACSRSARTRPRETQAAWSALVPAARSPDRYRACRWLLRVRSVRERMSMRPPERSRRGCASIEEPFGEAHRYGPVLRFGFFLIGPLELVERGTCDTAGLEPLVPVGLTAGAVGPATFFRDVERARWIDGRRAPMSPA